MVTELSPSRRTALLVHHYMRTLTDLSSKIICRRGPQSSHDPNKQQHDATIARDAEQADSFPGGQGLTSRANGVSLTRARAARFDACYRAR